MLGTEYKLLHVISHRLNFTYKFHEFETKDEALYKVKMLYEIAIFHLQKNHLRFLIHFGNKVQLKKPVFVAITLKMSLYKMEKSGYFKTIH